MAIPTQCPLCQEPMLLPNKSAGKMVRCKACLQSFLADAALPAGETPFEMASALQTTPKPPASRPATPEPPPRPAPPAVVYDEAPRRRRPRVDEAPEPPAQSNTVAILVGVIACVLLVTVGVGFAVWFTLPKPAAAVAKDADRAGREEKEDDKEPDDRDDRDDKDSKGGKGGKGGGQKQPVEKPPVEKPPVEKPPVEKPPVEKPPVEKPPVEKPPVEKPPVVKEGPPKPGPEVSPPALAAKVEKKLPGTLSSIAVGGAGRYLVAHLPAQRKLAVFDVNEARIVHYIAAPADNVKFAAGLEKLIVVLPDTRVVQRWALATGKRELAVPLPVTGTVLSLCMGSASNGPVLLQWAEGAGGLDAVHFDFLDPKTLKTTGLKGKPGFGASFRDQYQARASADGSVFGLWRDGGNPSYVESFVFAGGAVKAYHRDDSAGHVAPGPDGKVLYTAVGLYTNQAVKLGDAKQGTYIPAASGNYYFRVDTGDRFGRPRGKKPTITAHLVGDSRPLVTVADIDVPVIERFGRRPEGPRHLDERLFFLPKSKLVVTIPLTNDKLVLHRFDVEEALEKSGIDYLVVTSSPVEAVEAGAAYNYPLTVKSKQGEVKYKLDSGPEGMAISKEGVLTWKAPADSPDTTIDVIVSVADRSEQEVFHTFKVRVLAKAGAPKPPVEKPPVEKPPVEMPPVEKPEKPDEASADGPTIRPPKLADATVEKTLPSALRSLAVGGAGRYLVLHLPDQRKLAVFDVNEAKIARYVPVSADNVQFTAGLEKLVVVLPDTRVIQRWDLATGKREFSTFTHVPGTVTGVFMGSASRGPMLLRYSGARGDTNGFEFADLKTLKRRPVVWKGRGLTGHRSVHVRASANGRVFGMWHTGGSPQGIESVVLSGATATGYYQHDSAGHIVPGPDGRYLFTANGLFTNQAVKVGKAERFAQFLVPAVHGNYYLNLNNTGRFGRRGAKPKITVHVVGDARPLVTIDDIESPLGGRFERADERTIFIPRAKLVVTVPPSNDRLVLHKFDVEQAIKKSDIDYLVVTSTPPEFAARGADFTYPLRVLSKKGGVKYKIDSGPKDMTISKEGVISWKAPMNVRVKEADVIVSVSDKSGQEVFHSFKARLYMASGKPKPKDAK